MLSRFRRPPAEPPASPGPVARSWSERLDTPPTPSVLLQALELAGAPLYEMRLFWHNLQALRLYWPIVLPLLAVVAWRSYRRERAAVLTRRRAAAEQRDAAGSA